MAGWVTGRLSKGVKSVTRNMKALVSLENFVGIGDWKREG